MTSPPSPQVLAAFGLDVLIPRPLPGGQGTTWIAGDTVLKPVWDVIEADWVASTLCDLTERGFRVSRPVQSTAGTWTAHEWSAWQRVDGSHDFQTRWPDVIAAGNAFHHALRDIGRPSFLDDRRDRWSMGDRIAWDEQPLALHHAELDPLVEQLMGYASPGSPSRLPSQVIHGDLTGNVLFAYAQDPAVIDFVPYWRPVEFATAIVVADAIAWHRAGPTLARLLSPAEDPRSMLARAAIYRLVTADLAAEGVADESTYVRENLTAHRRILAALSAM